MSDKPKSVVKEVAVFSIGMGVLLAAAAYFAFTGLDASAPPLWGMQRNLAIGLPVALLAVANIGSGIMLIVQRNSGAVTLSVFSGCAISLFYFYFMMSTTGTVGINLITFIMLALPLLLLSRGKMATDEIKAEAEAMTQVSAE